MLRDLAQRVEKASLTATGFLIKIGVCFLVLIMMVTVTDVVMRYFGGGLHGSIEIVEFSMVILIFFSIGYIQACKKNIVVDLLYEHLPVRWRATLDTITSLVCFLLYFLFAYAAVIQTSYIYKVGEVSATIEIPKYPFVAGMSLGLILLCLVLLGDFLTSLCKLLKKEQ